MRANRDAAQAVFDGSSESGPASQRTTFDVAAVASIAGLHDTGGNVPLVDCVPARTAADLPAHVTRNEIRVLLRVDGATSLGEIADEIEIPLIEVVAIFLGFLSQGVVQVPEEEPPASRVVTKIA